MANDGQIVFEVKADTRHAKADIQELTRDIQDETKKWDKAAEESTSNIDKSFSSMLKKLAAGFSAAKIGKALVDLGKEAINLASDLQEVQNVVDVTFGASGAKQIESWAKQAGTQFGLTETQAKKFTSTLGAMMKSAGLSGDEIVGMSTDLAGLAADMASFYNLDFDTAFQKIRSGISGETEPLKQLGINMSVANLNAFALKQGLEKTFEQMTQGEQTMLRYQYMMQATADAQGDFARTSDGYANATRALETNITSLKTALGERLLPIINDCVSSINDLFPKEKRRTVLDDINDIDLDTQTKIAEIKETAAEAQVLIEKLETIGGSDAGAAMASIADGANKLNSGSALVWKSLAGTLTKVDGLQNIFSGDASTVEDLANALSGASVDTTKAEAWKTFLGSLSDNADALTKLTGTSVDETKAWLEGLADAADDLSPEDAAAWDTLLGSLVKGLSANTEDGQKFIEALATNFLAMGKDSAEAVNGLSSLGFSTDQISEKQEEWLKTCKELVKTIPGLSDIVNTETGAVEGGTEALNQYVEDWRAQQEKLLAWKSYYRKQDALNAAKDELYGQRITAEAYKRLMVEAIEKNGAQSTANYLKAMSVEEAARSSILLAYRMGDNEVSKAVRAFEKAAHDYIIDNEAAAEATMVLEAAERNLVDEFGRLTDAEEEATQAAQDWNSETVEAAKNAVSKTQTALTALADYVDEVHNKVEGAIDGVVKGFGKIETPMQQAGSKTKDLTDKLTALGSRTKKNADEWDKLNVEINKYNSEKITAQGMAKNLQDQAKYMEDYLANLNKAREMGVSNEVLAALSDGSVESFDYLAALAEASPGEVERINEAYDKVSQKKKELSDELASQQLTADQTYQTLAEAAKQAVAELDLEEQAAENSGKTVAGIAKGINDHVDDVSEAVDAICSELSRLEKWGISVDFGNFGTVQLGGESRGVVTKPGQVQQGTFAAGLDWVPADNFFAKLHEGESILNAEEAKVWRSMKNGTATGVDYDQLGGVMRDNVKAGGNVYLDGRVVGQVVSDRQGRSYKSLQRSGWQQ